MMEQLLHFLLRYSTCAAAGAAFAALLAVRLCKRATLSRPAKRLIAVLLALLMLYFAFLAVMAIAAGTNQPAHSPIPMPPNGSP